MSLLQMLPGASMLCQLGVAGVLASVPAIHLAAVGFGLALSRLNRGLGFKERIFPRALASTAIKNFGSMLTVAEAIGVELAGGPWWAHECTPVPAAWFSLTLACPCMCPSPACSCASLACWARSAAA